TLGGGGGGGAFRMFSRIHLPRRTGEVRVAYEDTISTLACERIPPRSGFCDRSTRRNSGPFTPRMLYNSASRSFRNVYFASIKSRIGRSSRTIDSKNISVSVRADMRR